MYLSLTHRLYMTHRMYDSYVGSLHESTYIIINLSQTALINNGGRMKIEGGFFFLFTKLPVSIEPYREKDAL